MSATLIKHGLNLIVTFAINFDIQSESQIDDDYIYIITVFYQKQS